MRRMGAAAGPGGRWLGRFAAGSGQVRVLNSFRAESRTPFGLGPGALRAGPGQGALAVWVSLLSGPGQPVLLLTVSPARAGRLYLQSRHD